jgi:hypothetical protein
LVHSNNNNSKSETCNAHFSPLAEMKTMLPSDNRTSNLKKKGNQKRKEKVLRSSASLELNFTTVAQRVHIRRPIERTQQQIPPWVLLFLK